MPSGQQTLIQSTSISKAELTAQAALLQHTTPNWEQSPHQSERATPLRVITLAKMGQEHNFTMLRVLGKSLGQLLVEQLLMPSGHQTNIQSPLTNNLAGAERIAQQQLSAHLWTQFLFQPEQAIPLRVTTQQLAAAERNITTAPAHQFVVGILQVQQPFMPSGQPTQLQSPLTKMVARAARIHSITNMA